jgi:hypothetical protein
MYPNLNGFLAIKHCKYGSSKLCVQGLCGEEEYPEPQQSAGSGAKVSVACVLSLREDAFMFTTTHACRL